MKVIKLARAMWGNPTARFKGMLYNSATKLTASTE